MCIVALLFGANWISTVCLVSVVQIIILKVVYL